MTQWTFRYEGFDPEEQGLREALCTLGNGYFATRGAAPEKAAGDVHYPGTYVAGLYNRLGTEMGGRIIENEDLVNVPNWLPLEFRIDDGDGDGGWFDIDTATVEDYVQELDLRRGVLMRTFVWVDPAGRRTLVAQRRFVSMRDPHVAGLSTAFRPENWAGRLAVRSAIDGSVVNAGVPRYRALNSEHLAPVRTESNDDEIVSLVTKTTQSDVTIAIAARHQVTNQDHVPPVERQVVDAPDHIAQELGFDIAEGQSIAVEKVITLYTSRDRAISEPALEAVEHMAQVPGFEDALELHVLAWDHLWKRFELESQADDDTRRILNLHVFHLLQTASKHTIDLDVGIPARGWHGEAYRGHIFWDELFIFPFLTLHMPDLTKALLQYRYRRLLQATLAARAAGYEGAMYPWQSGSNGREETQVVHLNPKSGHWHPDNSHRQRHISVAVAFNVWKYFEATEDVEFMAFEGAEMMVQIARFWASIATFDKARGRYEIRGVMGPDEYHDGYPDADPPAGLNNNAYTNVMVVWVLERARRALELVPEFRRRELWEKMGVRREELEHWEHICDRMYVPFHGEGIISQFDGYDELEEFDWEGYTERYGNIQRLDRILEAEGVSANSFKVSKQADLLMLFYLLAEPELADLFRRLGYDWDESMVSRNVDYYLARTSHGSTLSRVVQSFVLARSDRKRSWTSFQEALYSDVGDVQGGTTAEGIHLGAMAGTVDLVQRCFSGLETRDGKLWFAPAVPAELGSLRFALQYRGGWVDCEMTPDQMTITSREGAAHAIQVVVNGEDFELIPGAVREIALT
ncbi:MAG: glycosyl hydrolase family 65 protein [Actinomycetota bacterium]